MSTRPDILTTLRWMARLGGVASVAIVLAFFVGEGFSPGSVTPAEWVLMAFFPVGVMAGLLVGWRWEVWGGALSVASLGAFYLVHWLQSATFPRGWAFLVFSFPGLLFLA